MIPRTSFLFARQRIVVAGQDSVGVAFAIATLRHDGHCVTHAADARSALGDIALGECHLLIAGSDIAGAGLTELLEELGARRTGPTLLCLADASWVQPAGTGRARARVPVLHEPFTAEELRAAVRPLLPKLGVGSILALTAATAKADAHPTGPQPMNG